ncbi:glycoside hydrolase family 16 protein [Crucibulum laeve]|uniref:Glycoside hydrolase family 16 protein n=1 Tax=Crucibulum laeve TaxID=68775 RepID=A0A5C3LY99_9AGAR|nr:glycoside hydrolase family 16 protein [Crucibulum laeve]
MASSTMSNPLRQPASPSTTNLLSSYPSVRSGSIPGPGRTTQPPTPANPLRHAGFRPINVGHQNAAAIAPKKSHDSLSEKYSLSPSPASWGMPLHMNIREEDDDLHNPDPRRDRQNDRGGHIFTPRGLANLGCVALLVGGMLMLFAGYPILTHFTEKKQTNQGGFNLGGTNATGQVPDMPGNRGLIDPDTPKSVYTKTSYTYPDEELVLVFSDEFNTDGRSFYPGDDPYWEGVDLHYWGTEDLEWYDPGQATTEGGALRIKLEQVAREDNHNLTFRSAMVQTWNKFCFTGGILEAAVTLPGSPKISGFWPAVWAMGNLGRAGFGGSVEGLWPYTYDACDVGTLPNQTYPGTSLPVDAMTGGDPEHDGELSFLPGQRLSACTCPGESHPGPMRKDGSYVGRSAPEIDVLEAIVTDGVGEVSLSAQWAPFNAEYNFINTSDTVTFYDSTTKLNGYHGGAFQQTTSGLAPTNQDCYELSTGCFAIYAFEYRPGFDDGYISWINDGKQAWSIFSSAFAADSRSEISARPVSQEPMYIIANLGFSPKFGTIDLDILDFPATMSIDYIRVYQRKDAINTNCDPQNYPTAQYIETYKKVYTNNNITTWKDANEPWPKNRLKDTC